MDLNGITMLHGYGVRGKTWNEMRAALLSHFQTIHTPDLAGESINDLTARAEEAIRACSAETGTPIVVAGHSLGAVMAAVAARSLGPKFVGAVVLMAPPFGERDLPGGGILRFLLKHRLIPGWLIRPRFFSSLTPKSIQKQVFREAVPEHPALQAATMEQKWFHTSMFAAPLAIPSLVIASEADRIVPASQSTAFAAALGAELWLLPASRGVGHDDLFASATVVREIADRIAAFAGGP
jgi:alpha-beta hydrolase superfamily lysophospholipase